MGRELEGVDAHLRQRIAKLVLAFGGDAGEALAEARVMRVDPELFAGLGIAQGHQAEIGKFELQWIEDADRHHVVPLFQERQP